MKSAGESRMTRRDVLARTAAGAAAVAASGLAGQSLAAEPWDNRSADGPAIRNGRINQTLCAWCYKLPFEQLCQTAVKLGYKGIDLVGPESFAMLKKYNLVGTMVHSHSIPKGLNNKDNWDECLAKIRGAIDATSEAGFEQVICFSGNRNGMDEHEGMLNCAEAIKKFVGQAEKRKVVVCMELLNSKVDHHDYMCDHSAWGVELVKMVGSEHFRLLYDIYHMQIMEGDVIRTIGKNHPYFAHYHTGGIPGRHEIDDTQELYYPAVMRAILATGYKGWVGQEFLPTHDIAASLAEAGRICDV